MGWVAPALQIGSSLFGASQQRRDSSNQAALGREGLDFAKQRYADAQGNFSPYIQAGQGGLQALGRADGGDYSGFENSPDYQYARQQMIYGQDHSAAAKGRLNSGGYAMDLAEGLNGLASQNYGAWRGGQMGLAQLGAQSAGQLGSVGGQAAGQVMGGLNAIGQAQSGAYGANAGAGYGIANTLGNYFGSSYGNNSGGNATSNNDWLAQATRYGG